MILLQISAGQGPTECQRAVVLLAEHLLEQAHSQGLEARMIAHQPANEKGCYLSASLELSGLNHETFCQQQTGTVLWRCASPFRPNHGRKNWYVSVKSFTVPEESAFSPGKVEEQFFRASGPGGQHVNKTSSAVRLRHLATGIQVTASEERSQARNRKLAYSRLWAELQRLEEEKAQRDKHAQRATHYQLERGNPIRTFTGPTFKALLKT